MSDDLRIPSGLPIGYGGPKREEKVSDRDRLTEVAARALAIKINDGVDEWEDWVPEVTAIFGALTATPELAGVLARWAAEQAGMKLADTDLLAELVNLARIHHATVRQSKKHRPEEREWRDCDCLTCKRVACVEAVVLAEIRAGEDRVSE